MTTSNHTSIPSIPATPLSGNSGRRESMLLAALLYAFTIFWISQLGYSQYFPDTEEVASASGLWRIAFTVATIASACIITWKSKLALHHLMECHLLAALLSLFGMGIMFFLAPDPSISVIAGLMAMLCIGVGCAWANVFVILLLSRCSTNDNAFIAAFVGALISQILLALNQAITPHSLQLVPIMTSFVLFALGGVLTLYRNSDFEVSESDGAEVKSVSRNASSGAVDNVRDFSDISSETKTPLAEYAVKLPKPLRAIIAHPGPACLILGSALGVVVVRGIGPYGMWGFYLGTSAPTVDFSALGVNVLFGIALGALSHLCLSKMRLPRGFYAPFFIFALAFASYLIIDRFMGSHSMPKGIIQGVYALSITLAIFYASRCASCFGTDPLRTGGVSVALLCLFCLLWMFFLESNQAGALVVALVISYIFVLVLFAMGRRPLNTSVPDMLPDPSASRTIDVAVARLAEAYGLTPRERELTSYLLQGRTLPYISEKLYISEGTTRTHVQNIYKKINVHSKQELISLAFGDRC